MSGKEDTQEYFYVKSDPDHYDLYDIFKGVYIKKRKEWRFNKEQEDEVTKFLYCSSSESEEGLDYNFTSSDEDPIQLSDDAKELLMVKRRQRDRLHRANSFNASDNSEEDCESIDGRYRRHRRSRQKIASDVLKIKKELEKIEKQTGSQEKQTGSQEKHTGSQEKQTCSQEKQTCSQEKQTCSQEKQTGSPVKND